MFPLFLSRFLYPRHTPPCPLFLSLRFAMRHECMLMLILLFLVCGNLHGLVGRLV